MEIYVKNMVCNRCIKVVRDELEKIGVSISHIELGKISINDNQKVISTDQIKQALEKNGFELLENKTAKIVEKIKTLIIDLIYKEELEFLDINISAYLEKKIGRDYSYLSTLFSSLEHMTIEKFVILQKTERVKELLIYGELTLSEISYRLGYSSVQHLSNQFKKTTGLTPTHFKKIKELRRKPIDNIKYE
jgi:AraC family transcriptional regulator